MKRRIHGTLPALNKRLAKEHILTAIKDINLVIISVRLAHDVTRFTDPDYAHKLNILTENLMDLEDNLWSNNV